MTRTLQFCRRATPFWDRSKMRPGVATMTCVVWYSLQVQQPTRAMQQETHLSASPASTPGRGGCRLQTGAVRALVHAVMCMCPGGVVPTS